jgi:hypothetical protein
MDDQRHTAALTDEAVGDEIARDIARALAVDPSPEFVARVRTQIANEPTPSAWRFSWTTWIAGGAVAAAIVLAAVLARSNRAPAPVSQTTLVARSLGEAVVVPYVASAFRRTSSGPAEAGRHVLPVPTASGPAKAGPHVLLHPLFDPRETQALRALIAGVRTNRVDLSPLLRPGAPAPMELPPVDDLVIAPLAIEPLAPIDGVQGERQ